MKNIIYSVRKFKNNFLVTLYNDKFLIVDWETVNAFVNGEEDRWEHGWANYDRYYNDNLGFGANYNILYNQEKGEAELLEL